MNTQVKELSSDYRIEKALVGYEMAITLWTYEGELIWSKFNAMLVANSIVLAIIGILVGSNPSTSPMLLVGMPIVGLVLCLQWFLLTERGFSTYVYWILSARELEEQYLAPPIKTVSRGGSFADGEKIGTTINGKIKSYRMGWLSRQLKAKWISYLVIAVFAVMYTLFLVSALRIA